MPICPVDLDACDRPYCRGGHCAMADSRALVVCWECGTLDAGGIVHGICVECVATSMVPRKHASPALSGTLSPRAGRGTG